MAERFILPNADVGNGISPSDGAKLFFFDTGTSNKRLTFSDKAGTIENANPVISDGDGVFPDIFLDGTYKVVLQNKKGEQVGFGEADPVEGKSITNIDSHDTADEAAAEALIVGQTVQTLGRKTSGDGGAGLYEVVGDGTGIEDGGAFINSNPSGSFQLKLITSRPNMIQWGVVEGGVTDNVTTLQAFFDAQVGKCYGAPGEFLLSSVVTWPRFTEFEGSGYASQSNTFGTNFLHSGTGECFRSVETINTTTSVNLTVSSFRVRKITQASTLAAIAQTAGTFIDMSNIRIDTSSGSFSFAYGLVLDQSEVVTLTQINVEGMSIASFWMTNGDDYTPGANTNFTNDVSMRNCNSNGSPTGVLHDGGTGFKMIGGNLNGATAQSARISGLNEWFLDTVFMEGGSGSADIMIEQTTSGGTSVGAGSSGTIANCRLASSVVNNIKFNNASIPVAGVSIFGNLFGSARSGSAIAVVASDSLVNSHIGPNTNLGGASLRYLDADIYLSNEVSAFPNSAQLESKQINVMPGGVFSTLGSGKRVGVTAITTIVVGATYTVLDTDHQVYVTNTSGITMTVALPSGLEQDGRELTISQVSGTSPTIVDATTLGAPGDSVTIRYEHATTSWRVISSILNNVRTFANLDATPSVASGTSYNTFTNAITITDFDDGTAGQEITVVSKAPITYDTTGTNLTGSSVDIVTAAGDITKWYTGDGTTWILTAFVDVSADNSGGA